MSHNLDSPIAHEYRGHQLFVKFDWAKPNDDTPIAAFILQDSQVQGLADTIGVLTGPWPDYYYALAEAISVGERFIDSQLPSRQSRS